MLALLDSGAVGSSERSNMTAGVIATIVVLVLLVAILRSRLGHGSSVADGLARLPDPAESTEQEWVRAMKRRPTAISTQSDGSRLLQWMSGRYEKQHVVVLFNASHQYVRITHRFQC